MYPSLVLSAALIAPAAPVPRDTDTGTPGPAPRVLALKADINGNVRVIGTIPKKVTVMNTFFTIENNKQVQKQVEQDIVTSEYFNKTLADFSGKFMTAAGTPLTAQEATNRVKNGATLLASADGKPIAKAWLRAAHPDTVVMVADGLSHAQPQWGSAPMPTTPAPRLVMLGSDDSGKVIAPCTSHPLNANTGIYYDDFVEFGGRGGFRGGRVMRGGDIAYYGPTPVETKVVLKPLADVKFDAYDMNGKLIPRGEALKRLAAGGMVLVAGDNRMPDENYIKGLRDDVMVLVGPELVIPISPIDQTKKKTQKDQPANGVKPVPVPPVQIQPLPVIRGGLQKQVILPVPAVQKK